MTRLLAGWLIILSFSAVALASPKEQLREMFSNSPQSDGALSEQLRAIYTDDMSPEEAIAIGRSQENTRFNKSRMDRNFFRPLTGGGEMWTLDGQTAFDVSGVACPGANDYLQVTVVPSQTSGDIAQLMIRQDTNFDGIQNYFWQAPHPISGVCANGYISCNPGTWQNCTPYQWLITNDNRVSSTEAPSDDMFGCFCVNNSCGVNLAWINLNNILTTLGTGISSALQEYNAHLVITGAHFQNSNEIVYQAQDSANCSDVQGGSGVQYFDKRDDSALVAASSEAYINPESDTIVGKIVSESRENLEYAICPIRRNLTVQAQQNTWHNNRHCPEADIESWAADALAYECNVQRSRNADIDHTRTLFYSSRHDVMAGFQVRVNPDTEDLEMRWQHLNSSGTSEHGSSPWCNLAPSAPYQQCRLDTGHSGSSTGSTHRLRLGFDVEEGKIRVRTRSTTHWLRDSTHLHAGAVYSPGGNERTGNWVSFVEGSGGKSVIYLSQVYDNCSEGWYDGCYMERTVEYYIEVSDDLSRIRIGGDGLQTSPWLDITAGCSVECQKDVFSESISDGCEPFRDNPSCVQVGETVDGVRTINNSHHTGLSPIPSTVTFNGVFGTYAYTRPFWEITQEYACETDAEGFDFNDSLERYAIVSDSVDLQGGRATFTDRRSTTSGFVTDNYSIRMHDFGPLDPELVCKTRKWVEDPKATAQVNETEVRGDIGVWKFNYYVCIDGLCPAGEGEEIVQECIEADDFAEAAMAMETLDSLRKDIMCSSGVRQ
ncbi:hypothetical protein Selin_1464 [Desulfurispirillum indicum S5]|uniref:Uncharacterized protein n=1 Tax=Desulfurispirillum indicum (strain ATCC BAA-1389 / DSM 22839 / S5) TaxID=653733 RepID=E6W6V5_DESIS|nr:hypothetical protein [Desulfurispirillum indicum]ADU66198.1 hypothetical protein Selin_1464 [Desulfurispirillum indicum S5]